MSDAIPLYKTDGVRSASGLKITKIEVIALSITLPRDFRGSVYSVPHKNALVTRIHTDHGPIGEAVNGEGAAAIQREMTEIIERDSRHC